MNNALKEYCTEAIRVLEEARINGIFVSKYIEYRYDIFIQNFPHPIFGTNRTTEFFEDTIEYLDSPILLQSDLKKALKENQMYEIRYLEWIKEQTK